MTPTHRENERGFSLIEICIVMVIGGILLASMLSLLNISMKDKASKETRENLAKIETSLRAYLEYNNHYPCPASRKTKRKDKDFGKALETCVDDEKNPAQFSNDNGGTISTEGREGKKVRIGLLPFRSLGIPDAVARDGWGRIFHYAVTESLTNADLYDQKLGAIDVIDENGNSRVDPPATVQYVVLSSGEDGLGGYTADAVKFAACPPSKSETENCNDDSVFKDAPSSYKSVGSRKKKRSETDFDDKIAYKQYDPDIVTGSGILFYYYNACYKGFEEIDTSKYDAFGIDILNKTPSFNSDSTEEGDLKLCYSKRFSKTMVLLSKNDGKPAGCPIGWTEIGYRIYLDESQNISSLFRRRSAETMHVNNIVCAR